MTTGIKKGVTYYSDLRNLQAITHPVISNNANMEYQGHFDTDWDHNTLTFDNFGHGLKKTRSNQGVIFSKDSSKLFTLQRGYVGMIMSFPEQITKGVYGPLRYKSVGLNTAFLWGINPGRTECSFPTACALLTQKGIEFTIWSPYCKFTLTDHYPTIKPNTNVLMEFIWDHEGIPEYASYGGFNPTVCIRINEEDVVAGNPPIGSHTLSGLPFYVLDTPFGYSNLSCTIRKLVTGNEIPYSVISDWYSSSSSSSSLTPVFPITYNDLRLSVMDGDPTISKVLYSSVSTDGGQLQLNDEDRRFSHMWLPNSNNGTISRLDLSDPTTPVELGVYKTGINGDSNPSRTVVTQDGDCWVANRGDGGGNPSAIKIGNVDFNNCRGACNQTSDGPSDIKAYGEDDAVLLEFNTESAEIGLPNETADQLQRICRGIVEDANEHIWIHNGSTNSSDTWHEIIGDGGVGGNGSFNTHNNTGAFKSYGAVCSLNNNYIWSARWDADREINVFSADDPSINFTIRETIVESGIGTYGISYSRGYIYIASWKRLGDIYRISTDLVDDIDPSGNFWSYVAVFRTSLASVPEPRFYPRHFSVYVRDDNAIDEERTEDILISYWNEGDKNGGMVIIKDHKQYANGLVTTLSGTWNVNSDPNKFISINSPAQITSQAGVGVMKDIDGHPHAWVLSANSPHISSFDLINEEWTDFSNGLKAFPIGGSHYNYTNFTGTIDEINNSPIHGFANYVIDSGADDSYWNSVCLNASTDSVFNNLKIGVSASNNPSSFSAQSEVNNCEEFYLKGRYLNLMITFTRYEESDPSPQISDFTVYVGAPE